MSVDLQIRATVLSDMTLRGVQARLNTSCFPSFPINIAGVPDIVYIDHVDVAAASVDVVVAGDGNSALLNVPVAVFVVTQASLLAVPNGTPVGATTPAGQAILQIELTTDMRSVTTTQGQSEEHHYLDVTCTKVIPQGPLASAPVDWDTFRSQIGSLGSLDLNPLLVAIDGQALFRLPGAIESAGEDVVAVRFGWRGNPVNHLFPGQDWGLFLDRSEVERLASSRIRSELPAWLPFTPTVHWAPAGTVPHVDIDISGEVLLADVDVHVGSDLVLGPAGPSLRTETHWSIQIDLGWAIPAFVDKAVREYVEGEMEDALSPASLGAEPLGYHGFAFVTPLPKTMFNGNKLEYASLMASQAGMTLGGPIRLQTLSGATLNVKSAPFGLPTRLQLCSILAKSGSGAPHTSFTIQDATVYATINLDDAGQFCRFDPLGLAAGLLPFLVGPANGSPGAEHVFSFRLPGLVAITVTQPIRLIVRTARGVRLVELGVPPRIEVGQDGQITNGHDYYINNCLYIPVGPSEFHKINWGIDETITTNPDHQWDDFATHVGVDLQLVTLTDLEPGELIRFRSRDHAVDVTADSSGRAIVPVILPIDLAEQASASLLRVNRQAIAGHVMIDAVILKSQALLPAGERSVLSATGTRGALLTTEFEDRTEHYAVGAFGAPMLLGARNGRLKKGEPERTAQGLPAASLSRSLSSEPERAPAMGVGGGGMGQQTKLSEFGLSLSGVSAVLGVPGFPDAPVAVAIATAGPNLLLDVGKEGQPRVAGTFAGPIVQVALAGRSASAEHAGRVAIYGVTRSVVRSKV